MLGLIFRKAQNKIQDPAKLRRLIVELIGKENWLAMSADVKGDAYEGLLEKNAQDVKGGAGQYFTPRPLIQAHRRLHAARAGRDRSPTPPAAPAASCSPPTTTSPATTSSTSDQKKHLRYDALRGMELVDGVARLCAMNLFLHGIGPDDDRREPPITTDDALRNEPERARRRGADQPAVRQEVVDHRRQRGGRDRQARRSPTTGRTSGRRPRTSSSTSSSTSRRC